MAALIEVASFISHNEIDAVARDLTTAFPASEHPIKNLTSQYIDRKLEIHGEVVLDDGSAHVVDVLVYRGNRIANAIRKLAGRPLLGTIHTTVI